MEDTGPGITPALRGRLFEPFTRGAGRPRAEGLGLGLYIVRQLVEAQGGAVSARNRDTGGAVIGFTVPLAGEAPLPRGSSDELARTDGLV